jgi:beta-lactamase class D
MTDDQIIELARKLGWNVEHAETNKMLILFARAIQQGSSTDEVQVPS